MQIDPIKPTLKAPGIKLLQLKCDKPLSNFAFKFNLRRYTTVVVAAALLATVPYMMGERGIHYAYTACVLLVVACPCALVLSTPVVAVCGLTRAARRGVLVKGSAHLERLGRLRQGRGTSAWSAL